LTQERTLHSIFGSRTTPPPTKGCNKGQKRSNSSANKGRQQRAKEGVTAVPFSKAGSAAVL